MSEPTVIQRALLESARVCDESRTALIVAGHHDQQLINDLRDLAVRLRAAASGEN